MESILTGWVKHALRYKMADAMQYAAAYEGRFYRTKQKTAFACGTDAVSFFVCLPGGACAALGHRIRQ